MRTFVVVVTVLLVNCAADPGANPEPPGTVPPAGDGFPSDFPVLVDSGGSGVGNTIVGFGGNRSLTRAEHRSALQRRPVVLLHGNGTHAAHATFGMRTLRDRLLASGYDAAELWAPSYLGTAISFAELPTPYRNNIDDVRRFVDAVIDYLGVGRVDLIGHSLGCGMINGYMRGLQPDGRFDPAHQRFDKVGTVVCLGGALYGTGQGPLYQPEFDTGSAFVRDSLTMDGVEDATPFGASAASDMTAPTGTLPGARNFRQATTHDGGGRRIFYVALWATGDLVDAGMPNTGGLQGADVNRGFDLPDQIDGAVSAALARHAHLVHDIGVFESFVAYLDR